MYPFPVRIAFNYISRCEIIHTPRKRNRITRSLSTRQLIHRQYTADFQDKRRTYTVYFCRQCDRTRRPRLNTLRIAYFKPTVQLGAKLAYRIIRRASVFINDLRPDFCFVVNKSEICTAVTFLRIISVISRCKRIRTAAHIQRYALYRVFDNVERKLRRNSPYSAITRVSTNRQRLIPL